jgi:predicted nucleic acid-binding protein
MAYLQGEKPVDRIIDIIADANDRGDQMIMSVVNAGEVWYSIAQRRGPDAADSAISIIRSLGIELIDVDWQTTQIAARYKAKGGISYADCFAAAVAMQHKATLLTGDREFERVEDEITIEWL